MVFINNDIQNIILDILDNCDIDIQDLIYYYEKKNIINETISILGNIYNSLPENIENLICDEIDNLLRILSQYRDPIQTKSSSF